VDVDGRAVGAGRVECTMPQRAAFGTPSSMQGDSVPFAGVVFATSMDDDGAGGGGVDAG